jgi:methionine synthase II (cobalamin-independent)
MRCYKPGVSDQFYASREELAQDLAAIVHREIEWLIEQPADCCP